MLRSLFVLGAFAALSGSLIVGGEKSPVKSGPKPGDDVLPFHPLNVTGESAGKKACIVCRFGGNPVAAVFAREVNPQVARLIKKLDDAAVKNKADELGSFAVFCSKSDKVVDEIQKMAKAENLKETVIALEGPSGPKEFNLNPDAEVTVVLYTDLTVKTTHAFRKGELNAERIEAVVADVAKILPAKK
jgi:hypothetical protein